jgi:NADPH-dependent 2,4-dienoyl-CoA reductase/sulfur reductase-like enzyme
MTNETTVRPLWRRRRLAVAEAAERGHRQLLVALRRRIAEAINDCSARDVAPLSRRLQEIAKEMKAVDLRARQEAAGAIADTS